METLGQTIVKSAGEVIFDEGDQGLDLFLIKDGSVQIFRERGGTMIDIETLMPGQIFGALAILNGHRRMASARAITQVNLVVIEGKKLDEAVKRLPDWIPVVWRGLVSDLRNIDEKYMALHHENEDLKRQLKSLKR